jgi:hypothetical protein
MERKFTREELYELVWLKPMTQLADSLGISDVMLGKLCKKLSVPRPPRGYWVGITSSKNKGKWVKPPLMPLPSGAETYHDIVERDFEERRKQLSKKFDWEDLSIEIPPPPEKFIVPVDEQVDRLFSQLPNLKEFWSHSELHPATQKLIFADDQRKKKNYYFGWDKQIFRDEVGKKLIQEFNGFAWTIESLGGSVTSTGRVHMATNFSFIGHREYFSLNTFDPQPYEWRAHRQQKTCEYLLMIFMTRERSNWGIIQRGGKAPSEFNMGYVRALIKEILLKKENNFRDQIFREYEYCVERRESFVKRTEQKRLLMIQREKERIAGIKARREAQLFDAVERMRKADGIRQLVSKLEEKQAERKRRVAGFDRWSRWALQYAKEIDPISMSEKHLQSWIAK